MHNGGYSTNQHSFFVDVGAGEKLDISAKLVSFTLAYLMHLPWQISDLKGAHHRSDINFGAQFFGVRTLPRLREDPIYIDTCTLSQSYVLVISRYPCFI